jgi:hypothetical protein
LTPNFQLTESTTNETTHSNSKIIKCKAKTPSSSDAVPKATHRDARPMLLSPSQEQQQHQHQQHLARKTSRMVLSHVQLNASAPNTMAQISMKTIGKVRRLSVVTYLSLSSKDYFPFRLFAMVHQSDFESPDLCRWTDDGRSIKVNFMNGALGAILRQFFDRKCVDTNVHCHL